LKSCVTLPRKVMVFSEALASVLDLNESRLQKVLIRCLELVKGLNEVCKALDRKQAQLCVLAKDCDDQKYKKLVQALAKNAGIPVVEVESRLSLGEWLGHCKYDKENAPRKVKGTSSVAVVQYGEESEALSFVINYIKENNL
jgi:small subunit ribosomal protein S12e